MLLKLLALPITLPAAGIRFALNAVADMAEHELNSDEPVKEELLELQLALEEGTISERAYRAKETVLLARLRDIRERRRALASDSDDGEAGGRVVVELPEELR